MNTEERGFTMYLLTMLACTLFSMAALSYGVMRRPARIVCPVGWHNNGVRMATGIVVCTRNPIGDPDWDGTFGRPDRSVEPPGFWMTRIYCPRTLPLVIDDRLVQCDQE